MDTSLRQSQQLEKCNFGRLIVREIRIAQSSSSNFHVAILKPGMPHVPFSVRHYSIFDLPSSMFGSFIWLCLLFSSFCFLPATLANTHMLYSIDGTSSSRMVTYLKLSCYSFFPSVSTSLHRNGSSPMIVQESGGYCHS